MKMFHGLKHSLIQGIKKNPTVDPDYNELVSTTLSESQTILFSSEQAKILLDAAHVYRDTLDYKLPFPFVFLQFSEPIPVTTTEGASKQLCCLALVQLAESDAADTNVLNTIWAWYKDTLSNPAAKAQIYSWQGKTQEEILAIGEQGYDTMKAFAVAIIGYINCENIYLHREEGAPDKVNRKREKQGKAVFEPYYLCRIDGVQYDSNGEPISEGTHHGFRYDVRGHYRKLPSGRTKWIRPHQRGLQHELYVPKVYVVPTEPQQ